jgi:hypothetical protein
VVVGCTAQQSSSTLGSDPGAAKDDQTPTGGSPTVPAADAAPPKATSYRGNPLCRVTADSCMPDDDGYRRTANTLECATPPPDAGDAAAMESYESSACRVTRTEGVIAPKCVDKAASDGGDGAICTDGLDCAAGFDCVAGDKGTKTCRHYCCGGTCKGHTSQNGGATFCDVQSLTDVNLKAPVCMPLKRCTLLGTGECTQFESCAVVTESGDTGCVATGEAQVGASCDEDHCAATLTCLGLPGARKCFKLCKVSSGECGPMQVCTTSTVFKDPKFGICQKP